MCFAAGLSLLISLHEIGRNGRQFWSGKSVCLGQCSCSGWGLWTLLTITFFSKSFFEYIYITADIKSLRYFYSNSSPSFKSTWDSLGSFFFLLKFNKIMTNGRRFSRLEQKLSHVHQVAKRTIEDTIGQEDKCRRWLDPCSMQAWVGPGEPITSEPCNGGT